MITKRFLVWTFRLILLTMLFLPIWILGAFAIGDLMPKTPSEPGLVGPEIGMFTIAIINTILIIGLILSSRWYGWKLSIMLSLAYYGSFTFITQIESWYFLANLTFPPELLPRLFIMGLSIPLLYIPLAIVICKKWEKGKIDTWNPAMEMSLKEIVVKLSVIAVIYLVIYWLAGYFIAWQNPELRAFYGSPGEIAPFFAHTISSFTHTPSIILLQLVRGVLLAVIAMPIIYGSKVKPWQTALLVGFLLAIPHLGHIIANPLMPLASVRLSHMIETATSTFVFGLIIFWLLQRRHSSIKDLFSMKMMHSLK